MSKKASNLLPPDIKFKPNSPLAPPYKLEEDKDRTIRNGLLEIIFIIKELCQYRLYIGDWDKPINEIIEKLVDLENRINKEVNNG
jgi:hypothetical protein